MSMGTLGTTTFKNIRHKLEFRMSMGTLGTARFKNIRQKIDPKDEDGKMTLKQLNSYYAEKVLEKKFSQYNFVD